MEHPPLDIAAVTREVEARLERLPAAPRAAAVRTLGRLDPARWTLEWHLPWWVGLTLGVAPAEARVLVVSNVLGLIAIRLEDDLEDGEVRAGAIRASRRARDLVLDVALEPYRSRMAPASPFWRDLEQWLAERRATGVGPPDLPLAELGRPTWLHRLARRGAPLKVAVRACSLIAGRPDAWPVTDECLEHALAALVLYDHFMDWEADLAGGRWNAFVAVAIAAGPPVAPDRRGAGVLASLLTSPVLDAYFEIIDREARLAAEGADRLGCEPLAHHLRSYAASTSDQGAAFATHYRDVGNRATSLLLGGRMGRPTASR